jgi:hypothetical protein
MRRPTRKTRQVDYKGTASPPRREQATNAEQHQAQTKGHTRSRHERTEDDTSRRKTHGDETATIHPRDETIHRTRDGHPRRRRRARTSTRRPDTATCTTHEGGSTRHSLSREYYGEDGTYLSRASEIHTTHSRSEVVSIHRFYRETIYLIFTNRIHEEYVSIFQGTL